MHTCGTRVLCATCGLVAMLAGAPGAAASVIYYNTAGGTAIRSVDVDAGGLPTTLLLNSDSPQGLARGAGANELYYDSINDFRTYAHTVGSFNSMALLPGGLETTIGGPVGATEGLDGYWYSLPDPNDPANPALVRTDPLSASDPGLWLGDWTVNGSQLTGDLATSADGRLWGVTGNNELVTISKSTGLYTSVIGTIIDQGTGLPVAWNGASLPTGMAFTQDGRLFIAGHGGDLYNVSTLTGVATFVGMVDAGVYDMASELSVPAPGAASVGWAVLLMAGRRRR